MSNFYFLKDEKRLIMSLKEEITRVWSDFSIKIDKELLMVLEFLYKMIDKALLGKLGDDDVNPEDEFVGILLLVNQSLVKLDSISTEFSSIDEIISELIRMRLGK